MSKFVFFNPNPSYRSFKNGKEKYWTKADDSIRALCKVLEVSWEEAFDMLSEQARSEYDVATSKSVLKTILENKGYKLVSFGKPGAGQKRPTVEEFVGDHKIGTYILNIASNVVPVIDGRYFDANDCGKSSVYSWYVKED